MHRIYILKISSSSSLKATHTSFRTFRFVRSNLRSVVALVGKQRTRAAGAGHPTVATVVAVGHRRCRRRREVARFLLRLRRWPRRNFTPASGGRRRPAVDGLEPGQG